MDGQKDRQKKRERKKYGWIERDRQLLNIKIERMRERDVKIKIERERKYVRERQTDKVRQ